MTPNALLSSVHALLVRWFVRFNPLFTASALCILGGVFLLSGALGTDADLPLTAVLEVYQWSLIGAAALLYRRLLKRRSAVILGLIELAYLGDPTLQMPALAWAGAAWANAAWMLLSVLKLRALAWAFRLRLDRSVHLLFALGAATVACMPVARMAGGRQDVLFPALLAGAVLLGSLLARRSALGVTSLATLEGFGATVFQRAVRGTWWAWGAALAYHAWNSALAIGLGSLLPAAGAALLGSLPFARRERDTWSRLAFALVLAALAGKHGLAIELALAAPVLLLTARTRGPRFITAAVLSAYALLPLLGIATDVPTVAAAFTAPLLWLLARQRAWSAVPALTLVMARGAAAQGATLPVLGATQWGVVLVSSGFLLLGAGVVLHGLLGALERSPAASGAGAGAAAAPCTSAAPPSA